LPLFSSFSFHFVARRPLHHDPSPPGQGHRLRGRGVCQHEGAGPVSVKQRTAYSVQCTAYTVQRTAYSVQRTAYSVQLTACNVQRTTYNVQRTTYSVKHYFLVCFSFLGFVRFFFGVCLICCSDFFCCCCCCFVWIRFCYVLLFFGPKTHALEHIKPNAHTA
jgi:hypothetical protein